MFMLVMIFTSINVLRRVSFLTSYHLVPLALIHPCHTISPPLLSPVFPFPYPILLTRISFPTFSYSLPIDHMQPLDRAIISLTESVRQFTDSYHYIRGRILTCHTSMFYSHLNLTHISSPTTNPFTETLLLMVPLYSSTIFCIFTMSLYISIMIIFISPFC